MSGSDLRAGLGRRAQTIRNSEFTPVWVLAAALFIASAIFVPGTVDKTSLLSMLPFAAILAITAIGQTLVVQQGGIDLSVAGVFSLSAVIVVQYSHGNDSLMVEAVLLALGAGLAAGLVTGIVVTRLAVSPLIATLAMNAVLVGFVLHVTGGNITAPSPPALSNFVTTKVLGLQLVVWIPILVIVVLAALLRCTVPGRRFELVGASPPTAYAMGVRVQRYELVAYAIAGLSYAAGGVLLAAFISRPGLSEGNIYTLQTIAAVAIAGVALGGGRASLIAVAVSALFLTQLNQVSIASDYPTSVQYLIQGLVIVVGIGLRGRGGITRLVRVLRIQAPLIGSAKGKA
jgi:ribose transport system permease protein